MASLEFELKGQSVTNPEEWKGAQVLMTWDNSSVQANITIESFTLVADAARLFQDHIRNGLNNSVDGYFIGAEAVLRVTEDGQTAATFNGYTDNKKFVDLTPNDTNKDYKVEVGFQQFEQIEAFKFKARGITWQLIEEQGFFPASYFEELLYVIQKPQDNLEAIAISFQITFLTINLIQVGKALTKDIINATAHVTGGLSGPVAGAVYVGASILVEIVTAVAIIVQLVNLVNEFLRIFLPMPRFMRVVSLKNLLTAGCKFMGYDFKSSLAQLDRWYIAPSQNEYVDNNPFSVATTDTGYFASGDDGYLFGEFTDIIERIFNGKFQIDGTDIYFEPLVNKNFWLNNKVANYTVPNTFIRAKRPNGDETSATTFVTIADDNLDEWTTVSQDGYFATEVIEHVNPPADPRLSLLNGLEQLDIPWSFGTQKETLNTAENTVKDFFQLIASIADLFGQQPPKLVAAFQHIAKALKISNDLTSKPKLLSLEDITVSSQPFKVLRDDHRTDLSAESILNNFQIEKSLVGDNYSGQWVLYEEIRIPFGFSNFLELTKNNYFKDQDGNICRMDSVKWEVGSDSAVVDYRINIPYDKNLKRSIFTANK